MRFEKPSAALLGLVLLFACTSGLFAAADSTVSGRLLYENAAFACDRCVITLLVGERPVATVFADLSGGFTFTNVPRGSFTIHAEIDGFEPVNYQVEASDMRMTAIVIPLVRNPKTRPTAESGIVDVSEFLDRYPKKAVSFFEKGAD